MADESRTRTCRDCGEEWEFTEKDEAFLRKTFGDKYTEPTRCIPCRKINKEKKASQSTSDLDPARGTRGGRFSADQPNLANNQPKRQRARGQ
jgi:hypothetical protein